MEGSEFFPQKSCLTNLSSSRLSRKRNREAETDESDGDSGWRKKRVEAVETVKVREMPITIDVGYVFQQFLFARKKTPYDRYKGWGDEKLWCKVLDVVNEHSLEEHSMGDLLTVFQTNERTFRRDPTLSLIHDELRTKLLIVFEEKWEDAGVPFIPDRLQKRINGGGCSKAVKPPREHMVLESLSSCSKEYAESFTSYVSGISISP